MDVNVLLEHLRQEPTAFAAVWEEEAQQHGRGALVFYPAREEGEGVEGTECEYWTLDEIRSRLRDLGLEDEFPLRWLVECDETRGLPVIIVSPDRQPGFYNLCFHRLSRPALLE